MLKLTMWSTCESLMQEYTHTHTHTHTHADILCTQRLKPQVWRELCLFGMNELPPTSPLTFLHLLLPLPLSSLLCFLHTLSTFSSLTSSEQRLSPSSPILQVYLLSFSPLTTPLSHHFCLFLSSPLSWHKISHTDSEECQECARSCSIMLLLHIWLQPQNLRSMSVFFFPEPMDGWVDGWMDGGIEWLMKKWDCWPSP